MLVSVCGSEGGRVRRPINVEGSETVQLIVELPRASLFHAVCSSSSSSSRAAAVILLYLPSFGLNFKPRTLHSISSVLRVGVWGLGFGV